MQAPTAVPVRAALLAAAASLLAAHLLAARHLLALQAAPLRAAVAVALWLRLWLSAAAGAIRWDRRRCPSLVVVYSCCVGGYHCDVPASRAALAAAVAAAAPELPWRRLPTLKLFFDDQVNWPADACRSLLGYVVHAGGGAAEVQAAANAWAAHPLVAERRLLRVGVFPAGDCLTAAGLPCAGPLCYVLTFLRAVTALRATAAATGVHSGLPGLLELSDPAARRVTFLLPLEPRTDLLPFAAGTPRGGSVC